MYYFAKIYAIMNFMQLSLCNQNSKLTCVSNKLKLTLHYELTQPARL